MAPPRRVEELKFADRLRPFDGELEPDEDYELYTFSGPGFSGARAGGARFLECAFSNTAFDSADLRRSRFSDVWLREVRLVSCDVSEAGWLDVTLTGCVLAGVQAYSSSLRRVTLRECKLDSVNFRDCALTDVLFEDCVLRDADFGSAKLTRVRFPGCTIGADFTKVTGQDVDLRGADLRITAGYDAMRGTTIDTLQLVSLAPLLARHLGITVEDT
jgi:uncharacterized protein YjbI with pentapeptide repeats